MYVSFKIAATYEVVQLDSRTGNCQEYHAENGYPVYDLCMYARVEEILLNELNCTVPWLPNRQNVCAKESDRQRSFLLYQNHRRNQQGICPSPCAFTNVFFGPPVEEEFKGADFKSRLIVYFRRDVKVTKEYYLVSEISTIAEIGGYASLLLGFSLYNLTDVMDHMVEQWHRALQRLKNALQKVYR